MGRTLRRRPGRPAGCVPARLALAACLALALAWIRPTQASAFIRPPFYTAKPVQATVVDEATRQPVEGVVVVAVWELSTISGRGHVLQIDETVTNAQGRFSLPGFGPRLRPPLHEAQDRMPYLILFKHGYVPLSLHNTSRDKFVAAFGDPKEWTTRQLTANLPLTFDADRVVQESFWNGLTIELEPFRGTPTRWFELLEHAVSFVSIEDSKHTPRFYRALLAERAYFERNPPDAGTVKPARFQALFISIQSRLRQE
ncbi:MAG TPA: hypothetical protein VNO23_09765 [Candidatus Binatia bacterium]|nr:hypothetical protein [Candidatus Binatia bacterium]